MESDFYLPVLLLVSFVPSQDRGPWTPSRPTGHPDGSWRWWSGGNVWRTGWQGLGWYWARGTEFLLPQAPLKKLPLGGLLNRGPGLEEDIPEPEELDWWSKYCASLQELQGQVGAGEGSGGGSGGAGGRGGWMVRRRISSNMELYRFSKLLQPSLLIFTTVWEVGDY